MQAGVIVTPRSVFGIVGYDIAVTHSRIANRAMHMADLDILIIKYYLAFHGIAAQIDGFVIPHAEYGACICSGKSSNAAVGARGGIRRDDRRGGT